MRKEKDILGEVEFEENTFYGINTYRALKNFPNTGEKVNPHLIKSYVQVKKAAAKTNFKCGVLSQEKYFSIDKAIDRLLNEIDLFNNNKKSEIYNLIVVDPYQGGAGTSLNMNINEVIANFALIEMGKNIGEYNYLHPIDDVNMSQSTNDTFPTALKVAAIQLLREMQESFSGLQKELQTKEKEFSSILKLGRTQLQDAVPISLGQEFGSFAQAIGRDRWRFYNCEERLRSVNLGGTAIGNSILASNKYVLSVTNELREICGLPIAKAEDLIENTQNLDVFIEVHGIVKAGATTIIKYCNDLRILSSGPDGGIGEIIIPKMQAGSTIMPGKVNPVILENSIQICELVKGHDIMISNLVSAGNLELNQFLPMIAHLFLKSLSLLKDCSINLSENCIRGIKANKKRCTENLLKSKAIAALLIPKFGYDKIAEAVDKSEKSGMQFLTILQSDLNISTEDIYTIIEKELGIRIEINS